MKTILLAEPEPRIARTLSPLLASDYRVHHCMELARTPEEAGKIKPDAIVIRLPSRSEGWGGLLCRIQSRSSASHILVLGAEASKLQPMGQLPLGRMNCLPRGCSIDLLRRRLGELLLANAQASRLPGRGFLGHSAAIKRVVELIGLFAASEYPVLIVGESGTGKEIAAKSLHEASLSLGPFVTRNCAAIPETIAESELFGTERGAFTDALSRPGAFELCDGGSIFLDEIGEAGLALQAKLLRALESGEFWRLGARRGMQSRFRFVSATSRNLEEAVAERRFRPDLLYRINTLVLPMPALRERAEDIPDLASSFALDASRGRTTLGAEAMDKLSAYSWPGNVRQLRNVIHRALVLAGKTDVIEAGHIVF